MAGEVAVPNLGMGWKSGRIARWYCPDGATVSAGELVFCLESEYVTVDVEAETDGIVRHRALSSDHVTAGEVVALVLAPGERVPEGFDEPARTNETEAEAGEPLFETEAASQVEAGHTWDSNEGVPREEFNVADTLPAAEDAPEEAREEEPRPILPLRRNTLPEPPPIPDEDSSWAPVIGDDLRVGGEWKAGTEIEEAFETAPVAGDGEPPVKEPGDDPRRYFDVAPFAPGVTRAEDLEPSNESPVSDEPAGDEAMDAFAVNLATAAANVQYLRTRVDLREVRKMCAQLAREWQPIEPRDEDVLVRAAGRALVEAGMSDSVALVVPEREGTRSTVLGGASSTPFREAVESLSAGWSAPAENEHGFELVSFAEWGIDEGSPELTEGRPLALSVGAVRELAVVEGNELVPAPMTVLTLAYDPAMVAPGQAAWFLARVRDLLEAPYALLAA